MQAARLVAFAIGVSLAQALDGAAPQLSLRRPDKLAFVPSTASSLVKCKTIENKCVLPCSVKTSRATSAARMTPLMMGRAAAVRAQTKGKTDAAKAKTNARYGKMISMAVKTGGNDPIANRQLAKLIEQAKALGVPKSNIDGILKKSKDVADFKESIFEAYAHGGAGFVIRVLTDNNNRASADVNTVMKKNKLKSAEIGSVSFNFDKLGKITVLTDKDEDAMLEQAMEAGADDLEGISEPETPKDAGFYIYTGASELMAVADALREAGVNVKDAELIFKGKAGVDVSEADEILNLNALDALEELDDVDAVFHNMA